MADAVHTLVERYSPVTGRAWLEVRGEPRRVVPVGPGYAAERARWKATAPDRPWDADWSDGTFWPSPLGLPLVPVAVGAALAAAGLAVLAGLLAGPTAVPAVVVALAWPLARLFDGVSVTARGIRVGSLLALRVPWHEVEAVGLFARGRERVLWVRGRHGAASATVPPVLVPAVRARIRRLGGLVVAEGDGGLDLRYATWRAPALGLPWGVLLGSAVALPFAADPFRVAATAFLVVTGLGALGASVEARATGWGTGAVGWLTAVYAVVLAALSLGPWLR